RNRVFARIIGDSPRYGKKPGFLDCRGWPETGFLRKLLVTAQKLKKTRFLRLARVARNRVFTKILGDSAETQKNPVS
ncbi:MAG: hypothetical protein EAZ19_30365, partial [Oscillatoriales cyanobacterium]